ncbi:hypothetical protein KQI68_07260 [Peptoniphilus sp. MSJ-1]|uniref:Uncharacterized protein n=1 Tax=Peptoniphilus ovalis TaxID=2841503 RepID=A0ABS6FHI6_9FIRM|nr:hypothetical protein [Peptoniphilus ovalis]MBU5669637.1 hypothetical protein [Peptoniphilus ovalis]
MKQKATRRDINNRYDKVIRAGYCEFQTLLRGLDPVYYNNGIYGWNWDCYELDWDIALVTGYRNQTGKRIKGLEAFEERAKEINEMCKFTDWDKKKRELEALLKEFIEYINRNYKEA